MKNQRIIRQVKSPSTELEVETFGRTSSDDLLVVKLFASFETCCFAACSACLQWPLSVHQHSVFTKPSNRTPAYSSGILSRSKRTTGDIKHIVRRIVTSGSCRSCRLERKNFKVIFRICFLYFLSILKLLHLLIPSDQRKIANLRISSNDADLKLAI